MNRSCSRAACAGRAVATLTFDYAQQRAVLAPLASEPDPGGYDLCAQHAERLSAPRGWEVQSIGGPDLLPPSPDCDDLMALAQAVRAAGFADHPAAAAEFVKTPATNGVVEIARRGHLRVLADADANGKLAQ